MSSYLNTPAAIMEILELFQRHKLDYILFKCEHIFEGQNKNVDLLFRTREDYHMAARLLEQRSFAVRLSEKIEKYKTLYTGLVQGALYSIHLHQEIAWHGLKAMDKAEVFHRKKMLHPLIIVPSIEDYILIHAGHALFENGIVLEREQGYLDKLNQPGIDQKYIQQQLKQNHWSYGFQKVLLRESQALSITEQLRGWSGKLLKEPAASVYLLWKALRKVLRPLALGRKGSCIALIGVNGSGKSTLSRQVLQQLEPLTRHLGKKQHYYYFGWQPEFFLTQWISSRLNKKGRSLFQELNFRKPEESFPAGFSLKQELAFGYLFVEFLYRYLRHIYPKLRRGEVVVADRYFYDIYGQYPYAKSLLLKPLLRLFPSPDKTYVLDAELERLTSRDKTDREKKAIESTPRLVLPRTYLEQQRKQYFNLAQSHNFPIISTGLEIQQCVDKIITENWRRML